MNPVSIIIPAWNESKTLGATLEALWNVDYDKTQIELIVVAGGDDGTFKRAQNFIALKGAFSRHIVIRQSKRQTKNAAVQQGLREAVNPIIVLLDADTIVSPNWLRSMVQPLEDGRCDLTIANSEPVTKNWVSDYFMILKTYFVEDIATYPGHSIALRVDALDKGLSYFFDPNIWMGDDYVLESRMKQAGKRTMFVRDAVVKTHFPCSLKYFMKIETRWLRAYININGVNLMALLRSSIVIGSLLLLVPFSWFLFIPACLFHGLYIARKVQIFAVASREYRIPMRRLLGFVFLSYICHFLQLTAHSLHILGLREDSYYQGERNLS